MKKFHFYSKYDSKKEIIMTITSVCLEDALECFCITKQLSQKDFKNLFKVEEAK
jgi:hypothetical protein